MSKTTFDPRKHHRHSIRLPNYNYAQPGGYFITIVTYHRDLLFGEIVNQTMRFNSFGRIVDECWRAIPEHFPNVELGAYVVMPNHVHGIIIIHVRRGTIPSTCGLGRCIVPLRNNFRNPYRVPYRRLSARSRQRSLAGLSVNTISPASGSETTTNTPFETRRICKIKPITSTPIRCCGMKMMKIR